MKDKVLPGHPLYGKFIEKYLKPGEYSIRMASDIFRPYLKIQRIKALALKWHLGEVRKMYQSRGRPGGSKYSMGFLRRYKVFTEKEMHLLWDAYMLEKQRHSRRARKQMLERWAEKRASGEPMVVPPRSPYHVRVERRLQAHRRSATSPSRSSRSSRTRSTSSGSLPTSVATRMTTSTPLGRTRKSPSSG